MYQKNRRGDVYVARKALTLPYIPANALHAQLEDFDGTTYCMYNHAMNTIEWDLEKNKRNQEKHGLWFEDASLVFEGATITFIDHRRDYGEVRHITFGELHGRCVVIAHTQREHNIRIISMRKANEREKKNYQKQLTEIRCTE